MSNKVLQYVNLVGNLLQQKSPSKHIKNIGKAFRDKERRTVSSSKRIRIAFYFFSRHHDPFAIVWHCDAHGETTSTIFLQFGILCFGPGFS